MMGLVAPLAITAYARRIDRATERAPQDNGQSNRGRSGPRNRITKDHNRVVSR